MRRLVWIAILLAACSPATSSSPRAAQTVSGDGELNSAPISLAGDYAVTWTADTSSQTGCYLAVDLQRTDGGTTRVVNSVLDGSGTHTGETRLYGLAAASYYLKSISSCKWSFTFTPA